MKTIQSEEQRQELKGVVEKIVKELEGCGLYEGKLSIERVLAPPGASTETPAGYPHLMVSHEKRKKLLGLIPVNEKTILCIIKEGFYDVEGKERKDMFVLLKSKGCEAIVKKHLEEYGRKNQVTEVVCKMN